MSYHHRSEPEPVQPAATVVALHCSGASGRQWRKLNEQGAGAIQVIAPDLYGCASVGQWTGQHAFSLADEAERILSLPELGDSRRFHLVGHSYGGGVALKLATMVPDRIASLALYEPSAFHLLDHLGPKGRAAFAEIRWIATSVNDALLSGHYQAGAARFVDYWNGAGSWAAMRPEVKAEVLRYLPKACLDFRALFEEETRPAAYLGFGFAVLIMVGEFAPAPTRLVAHGLAGWVADTKIELIEGAGHMGPVTHAETVNERILAHVAAASAMSRRRAPAVAAA